MRRGHCWTLVFAVLSRHLFADIFYNNCFKNGILPLVLPQDAITQLMQLAEQNDNSVTVDLPNQLVRAATKNTGSRLIHSANTACLVGSMILA